MIEIVWSMIKMLKRTLSKIENLPTFKFKKKADTHVDIRAMNIYILYNSCFELAFTLLAYNEERRSLYLIIKD